MNKFLKHFRMGLDDVTEYVLQKTDWFDNNAQLKAFEIGDGNINYVFKVVDEKTNRSLIVKQADVLLRSSGRPLDVDRNRIEAAILQLQGTLAPGLVPEVFLFDPMMCVIVMEDISDYKNLRHQLLARKTFSTLAEDISTFLVNTLLPTTDLVMEPAKKKDNVRLFINKELCEISEDLVFTEPFVDYKHRNVITKGMESFVQHELYDDKKLILEAGILKNNFKNNAQALIHGDLHSGSIFANENGIKILDPEFATYSAIGYDVGNVIGNLYFSMANALVTESNDAVREHFVSWCSVTICQIIDLFAQKFRVAYDELVIDPLAMNNEFREWYLSTILSDTAGSAGLEIIRRVVGDTKVADITQVQNPEARLKIEQLLIILGKKMIMTRNFMQSGTDYVQVWEHAIDKVTDRESYTPKSVMV